LVLASFDDFALFTIIFSCQVLLELQCVFIFNPNTIFKILIGCFCREDDKCWLLPIILFLFKSVQARFVSWHIANLEVQDFSLFCPDPDAFWAHESGL
jgi:hypothetical protein